MKRYLLLCFGLLTAVFVFAACGGETAVDVEVEAEPTAPTLVEEPETEMVENEVTEEVVTAEVVEEAIVEDSVEEETVVEEPSTEEVAAGPHDTTNLSLIGNTGRPQFLNAYASW